MELKFKEKYLIILAALCLVVIAFYYSYAIFVTKQLQENVILAKTAVNNLTLKVNNGSNKITVNPNYNQDINITFTNNEGVDYHYLVLVKGIAPLIKVSSNDETKGTINNNETKELTVHITSEELEKHELEFIVVISNNDNIDKTFGYSYINSKQNYDHTGANKPEITSTKLIPASYHANSEKDGYWYKSDVENTNSLWYDYDNGIWANAILVSNENYQKYQKMPVGSEIDISDILGMYVWIPRFKYYIVNSANYTNYERINDIIFEEGNNDTATVKCTDKISNLEDKHIYSEVCNDLVYNHIYDNLSTYTHPSFVDENGFWVSKFLIGEGDKSLPNIPIIKRKLSDASSISQKSNGHVLTNMEYAAIILLSNSTYGKTGNSLYYDKDNIVFERIYANLYERDVAGCSSEYNTYSKSFITDKTSKCIPYNDLTILDHYSNGVHYPIGYAGAGASSTGNVYGVYDLVSINGEITAAFIAKEDGSVPLNISKYDLYSYSDYIGKVASSGNIHNLYRYKLGDAIRENFRTFNVNGMWHNGMLLQNVNSGVLVRGKSGDDKSASVYTTSIEDIEYEAPFRIVLK